MERLSVNLLIKSVVILVVLLSLTTCRTLMSAFEEPVLSLHSVELTNINLNGVQLLCKVQVENPNSFNIPYPQTDWELFINTNSFVNGTIRNNQRLSARNSTIVEVPVNFEYQGVFNSFRSLIGSRQVGYKIALGINFSLPVLGDKVWNFQYEDSLPLPQLPQVRAPSMRMENANITRALLNVTINVVNPNPFEIPKPGITYEYLLNRNSFIKGELESDGSLAANSTTPIVFQIIVNYADLFRNFSAMRNLFEVPSLLIVTCDLGMPILSSEPLRFEVAGTLPVLR